MLLEHVHSLRRSASVLIGVGACAMLSACSAMGSGPQTITASSAIQPPTQPIAQLQQARSLDEAGLRDLSISVERRGDFLQHEARADHLIRDLQSGIPVSTDELTYASAVPPRHIEPEQRTALVHQLRDAIDTDEQHEQAVVAFSSNVFYEDPDAPSEFDHQEQLARREMQNLQAGNHVSWDELQQALYVPPNPL
jgi:hypothetical protein